jgi:hypothetical protein
MRTRALALVIVALAALTVPAGAAHPNFVCLTLGGDSTYPTSNDNQVDLVGAVVGTNDADHTEPHQAGCIPTEGDHGGNNIDFEITGAADPDSSDSPSTPDLTCTIPTGSNGCQAEPPVTGGGVQTIRAWLDLDGTDATVEADTAEGYDEDSAPGETGEPDATDVQNWYWTHGDPPPPPCGPDDVCWQRVTFDPSWRNMIVGKVVRESDTCEQVQLWLWKIRSGRDRLIHDWTEFGNRYGPIRWRIELDRMIPRGRYYVVVSKTFAPIPGTEPPDYRVCTRDRSPIVRVR